MQNVWGMLRTLAHIEIIWTRPYPDLAAATDGRQIWIDPALSKVERHCLLAHEAIHIKHGHQGCQTGVVEQQVCLEAAQFMVPFEDLQRVVGWSSSPWDMAEELGVTEKVVIDRLRSLTVAEVETLWPPSDCHP